LRRSVHRLEKGLIMVPRNEVFGTDYIGEAIRCYADQAELLGDEAAWNLEFRWATDVLATYFETVGAHPEIDKARAQFRMISQCDPVREQLPYERQTVPEITIGYEELYRLALRRRSVRWFDPKKVPRDLIDRAVAVAALAPSACNRQPFTFRICDDPKHVRRLAALPMGTRGFGDQIPALVVIVGDQSAFSEERDRHLIYIDGALAAMSMMFALETLGLASCPINWPDIRFRETQIAAELKLHPEERVVMLLGIGYPKASGRIPYSQKKSVVQLREYIDE
jgi:nitroreductase